MNGSPESSDLLSEIRMAKPRALAGLINQALLPLWVRKESANVAELRSVFNSIMIRILTSRQRSGEIYGFRFHIEHFEPDDDVLHYDFTIQDTPGGVCRTFQIALPMDTSGTGDTLVSGQILL